MTTASNIVEKFHTLPLARTPSNVPYAVRKNSEHDAKQRKAALEDFVYSSERWPNLEYPQLNTADFSAYTSTLVQLLEDVDYVDSPEAEKDHIFGVIEQKLQELYRHQKIVDMLGSSALEQIEDLRLEAGNDTLEIFGNLDLDRFAYFLQKDRLKAATLAREPSVTGRKRKYATSFLGKVGDVEPAEGFVFETMDEETRKIFLADLTAIFPNLEQFLAQDIPVKVPVDEVLPYFDKALDVFSLREKGWRSRFTEGKQAEENPIPRTIDVGKNRLPFAGSRLKALPLHEAIHCLRANNAKEQQNAAHRLPTKTNLAFEEGFCKLVESIITGKDVAAGGAYYVSLGLQMGLDRGGERRDFRDTFEIMWRRQAMMSDAETPRDIRAAKVAAYQTMLRTTRGNAMDARDKSYSDGDQLSKRWMNQIKHLPEAERREQLRWVFSAQFDPTSPEAETLYTDVEIRV